MKVLTKIFWYAMGAIDMLVLLFGALGAFLTIGIISLPKAGYDETLESIGIGWDNFIKKL